MIMKKLLCKIFGHKYYGWQMFLNTDVNCERCNKDIKRYIPPPPKKRTV